MPVYTIAQGAALSDAGLLPALQSIAGATGGLSFTVRDPAGIASVFQHVSEDIAHGYLLAFEPAPDGEHGWHKIEVAVKSGPRDRKVRAREGYSPD